MTTVLLDGNIYDKLQADPEALATLSHQIKNGVVRVIATPIVVDELAESPFEGVPDWFPVVVEIEAVAIVGYARVDMSRLGDGEVFSAHRGESNKTKDAIIADSASSLADIFVSEDRRCRHRLEQLDTQCRAITWSDFREWLAAS